MEWCVRPRAVLALLRGLSEGAHVSGERVYLAGVDNRAMIQEGRARTEIALAKHLSGGISMQRCHRLLAFDLH
jgi:hypothetical protein